MGAADLTAWRRQNSDVVPVTVVLADGTVLGGSVMVPRDRQLRDVMNTPEPFIEFEDVLAGPTILAKASVRSVRPNTIPDADQLEKRLKALEKRDPYQILGVKPDADKDTLRAAYVALARTYHPDRFARSEMPAEIIEYVNVMARRINAANTELMALFGEKA